MVCERDLPSHLSPLTSPPCITQQNIQPALPHHKCKHIYDITCSTQHHAASRNITHHHAASRSITQHHAASRSITQHHAASRNNTQHSLCAYIHILYPSPLKSFALSFFPSFLLSFFHFVMLVSVSNNIIGHRTIYPL